MLGVIIGVAAVSILVSLGQSAQSLVADRITALGANMIMVTPAKARSRGAPRGPRTLTLQDVEALRSQATELVAVSPLVVAPAQVAAGDRRWATRVFGVSASYPTVRSWKLTAGEFFSEREVQGRERLAALGKTVADELFPNRDAVGAEIEVRDLSFRVVGVLEEKGGSAAGGENQDDVVLVPVTAALDRLAPRRTVNMVVASAANADRMEQATAQVRAILRSNHGITPPAKDDFEVRNQAEILAFADQALGALTAFLGAIAGVSLVVGGIGVMNIMLVSVTERTREIGIRLAVGARGSDVLLQFLVESVLLCVVGGLMGAGLTFGFAAIANRATEYTVSVGWDVVLLAIGFSAAIGIFFGLFPARKAAQLDPIEALRYE